MTDASSILMGASGRSAKFEKFKDSVDGTVVSISQRQQTAFRTNEPLVWKDGNPRLQVVITLQTDESADEDDDGMRTLFVKIPSQMQSQIANAVRKAGGQELQIGGRLFVRYESDKPTDASPAKQYIAKYEPPANGGGLPDGIDPDDLPF
jgi:hypothetical protein